MKSGIKTIGIFLTILFFSVPFLSSEVTKIYHSAEQADMPFIKVLDNGDLLVIFTNGYHYNRNGQLLYTIYKNGSWTSAKKAVSRARSSAFPQLAKDENGLIHLAYMDGSASINRDIYYAVYDPENDRWFSRTKAYISKGRNSSWPRIRLANDKIYITWAHNYNPDVGVMDICLIENTMDGEWPVDRLGRVCLSNSTHATSVHQDFAVWENTVHSIWMDDSHHEHHWNMYYSTGTYNHNTETWNIQKAERIFPSPQSQYYPAMTVDESGTVHIIYSNKRGPFWYSQKPVGGDWSNPMQVSTSQSSRNLVPYIKYSGGLIHAVWRQSTPDGEGLFYGRALTDGTWAEPVLIACNLEFPEWPVLDIDENGDVHVVWSDGDFERPRHIYYSKVELPGQAPEAVITANKTEGLIPFTVNFSGSESHDPDGNIKEYRWDFGDGSTATGKNVSHTYTEKGEYTARLTVIDNDIRTGVAEVTITASTGTPVPVINASATSGMVPLTVVFDGSQSNDFDGEIVSYTWNFGDGTTATGVEVTHEYTEGGDYTVTLTVEDNDGRTASASIEVEAFQKPVAIFTAEPMIGKVPLTVDFTATESYDPDGDVVTWRWDFGDGIRELSKNVAHTYSTVGNFKVYLQVVDNDGYTDATSKIIRVVDKPLPPLNIQVQSKVNRTMMYTDYINYVTWTENPENADLFTIVNYRIYHKPKGADDSEYSQVGEVGAGTFEYNDRGFSSAQESSEYEYAVTAVAEDGSESEYYMDMTTASKRNPGSIRPVSEIKKLK